MPPALQGNVDGQNTVIVISVFWWLALVALAGRFWGRHIKQASLELNDYAVVVGMIFVTGVAITILVGVTQGGLGLRERTEVPDPFLVQIQIAAVVQWGIANAAIKVSMLHLYCELFWTLKFRRVAYCIMGIVIAHGMAVVLHRMLLCRPLSSSWDPTVPGTCGNQFIGYLTLAVCNFSLDLIIVFLPIPVLWKLQMSFAKKLGIYFMFGIGISICAVTYFTIDSIVNLDIANWSHSLNRFAVFHGVEALLGIINACLPVSRPALSNISQTEPARNLKSLSQYLLRNSLQYLGRNVIFQNTGGGSRLSSSEAVHNPVDKNLSTIVSVQAPSGAITVNERHKRFQQDGLELVDLENARGAPTDGIMVTREVAWHFDDDQLSES